MKQKMGGGSSNLEPQRSSVPWVVSNSVVKQQHIRMDDKLYRQITIRAAYEDKGISELIQDLVAQGMKGYKPPKGLKETK